MADPDPYEYRTIRIPRGTDIDGAVVQLHVEGGLVTMDIRIQSRNTDEDWIRDAMVEAQAHPGRVITR
jgi:hypothetical protein